jgi:hypothetical protein
MENRTSTLRDRLNAIVLKIEPSSLGAVISDVFDQLIGLLDHLDLLKTCVGSDEAILKSHLILNFVAEKAHRMATYVETDVRSEKAIAEAIRRVIDGTILAIDHEIKRALLLSIPRNDPKIEDLRAELTRAEGLLRNCFQQSVISVALEFDSSINGAQLFDDLKLRSDQSSSLLEALEVLSEQVNLAQVVRSLNAYFSLIDGLKIFEAGFMPFLMYRDWAQFEKFVQEINAVRTEFEFFWLLGQFAPYIDTLIGQVKMRSVLRDRSVLQPTMSM